MKSKIKISLFGLISVLVITAIACASAQTPAAQPNPTQPPASLPGTPTPSVDETPTPAEPSEIEMVEALAPVDAVKINVAESFPPQYFVQVTSGLPNGCTVFDRYEVEREGETVNISIINMEPAPGQLIACTLIYGMKENNIALGIDFDPGVTYTVNVNDVTETFVAQGTSEPAPAMSSAPAPIERVEVGVDGSQYSLTVISRLPKGSSCSKHEGFTVERDGNTINVTVTNLEVVELNVPCTADLPVVETIIPLGSDFDAGETYTVVVNDEVSETFVAGEQDGVGKVSVPAPIENVEIQIEAGIPPEYSLVVISRQPRGSSCSDFEGFTVERDGSAINVTVTNLEVAEFNVPCTRDLPVDQTVIPLSGDFEPEETYTIIVNGDVWETFVAEEGGLDMGMIMNDVPAPIDSVEVEADDSVPPQYSLRVTSNLRNGCIEFGGFEVEREGNTINVSVTNLEPTDPRIMCIQVFRQIVTEISLGSDFEPGETYTVVVNDVETTFVASEVDAMQNTAAIDREFQIGLGDTISIEPEGLEITFFEVLEDSRCPADVTCISSGQARIMIDVAASDGGLGEHELILESIREDRSTINAGKYLVQIRELDPNPRVIGQVDTNVAEYVATLVVFELATDDGY